MQKIYFLLLIFSLQTSFIISCSNLGTAKPQAHSLDIMATQAALLAQAIHNKKNPDDEIEYTIQAVWLDQAIGNALLDTESKMFSSLDGIIGSKAELLESQSRSGIYISSMVPEKHPDTLGTWYYAGIPLDRYRQHALIHLLSDFRCAQNNPPDVIIDAEHMGNIGDDDVIKTTDRKTRTICEIRMPKVLLKGATIRVTPWPESDCHPKFSLYGDERKITWSIDPAAHYFTTDYLITTGYQTNNSGTNTTMRYYCSTSHPDQDKDLS